MGRASSIETDIERLQERRGSVEVAFETAQTVTDEAENTLRNLRREQVEIRAMIQSHDVQLAALIAEIAQKSEDLAELSDQIKEVEKELQDAEVPMQEQPPNDGPPSVGDE
jgi:chromosome segregation ATPase